MNDGDNNYWFRAKRYGWGWGLPITWQGWVVFVVWFAIFVFAMRYFIPRGPIAFLIFTLVMSLLLLAICYKKESRRAGDGQSETSDTGQARSPRTRAVKLRAWLLHRMHRSRRRFIIVRP